MPGLNRSAGQDTTPVRAGHEIDAARLERWMVAHVEGFAGPLRIEQFAGGQSNPTYRLVTPARDYVLRRKPSGELLPGAHAVDREARVMSALSSTAVPVPRVFGLCTDEGVIGTWFFVMERVAGRIVWDPRFPEVAREQRPAFFDAMNATIAALHSVDVQAVGLADYGKPGSYFARQIARWSRQYLADRAAGRDPHMDRLVEWLPTAIPEGEEVAIVHGDFRCDNMIFHASEPRVLAVLDWELSTLGHPLADFAYHAMMYRMPRLGEAPTLASSDLEALNIPGEADYIAAYCRRTGRSSLPGYEFALAFNFFRLAAIIHGIKGRLIRGNASSDEAAERAASFPALARHAWRQAERAGAR